jgi:anhydro-N-acetylmuramic acid kinase
MTNSLKKLISMNRMNVLGLMSGTSADGLDLALCSLSMSRGSYKCEVLKTAYGAYPDILQQRILKIASEKSIEKQQLIELEYGLADFYAKKIKAFSRRYNSSKIDLIGSHGQTIYHCDKRYSGKSAQRSATWQIVNGGLISTGTGIPVVSDFRINDVALGGSGAPLIPIYHYYMFANKNKPVAVLNIGGITNLTYIPANADKDVVEASDCGPGNMLLDRLTRILSGKNYDTGGRLALSGTISKELLSNMKKAAWYKTQFPKSLGQEQFGDAQINGILKKARALKLKSEDIIATVSEFTVEAVKKYLDRHFLPSELIVCGGGARNKYFMKRFLEILPHCKINSSEKHGLASDYVEAAGFALLAYMFVRTDPAALPCVTGANRETILGKLSMP